MSNKFNNPTVNINNELILFKPGTVEVQLGKGEVKVEALSGGAGIVVPSHAVDVSTQISTFKAMLEPNEGNKEKIESWTQSVGVITINVSENINDTDTNIVLTQCSLTNEPNFQFKPDGELDIEFKGATAR